MRRGWCFTPQAGEYFKVTFQLLLAMNSLACCFVLFALTSSAVSAQDSPLAKSLRKFDANKDGKLSGEEQVQARQAFNRGGRDLGNNGRPNPEFFERRKKNWLEQQVKFLDLNGNGTLEDDETKRADLIWEEIAAGMETMRAELTRKYDKNDDGELTQQEREASRGEFDTKRREIENKVMAAHPGPATPGN